jgi:protoheme ferro-lyase
VFIEGFIEFWFLILGSVFAFILGYYIRAKQVLNVEDSRYVPELVRSKNDPGEGHTAVIYFTHGEPETYNPIGWINQFKEFDEQKIPFIPFPIRPIFLNILRKKYLQVGKSDHRKMHHLMIKELERSFRKEGDNKTKFYLSFLDDEPRPDAAVIQALNEGASNLVVCEVFVSISNHTAEGEKQIKDLNLQEFNIPIFFTSPLWDSKMLHKMFLEKANAVVKSEEKQDVGLLLVGHGQPDQWDEEFPTETEHEIRFREQIIDLFINDGYKSENLSLAWMEFKNPKPAEKIKEFIKNGVKKIVFFSAGISADSIHSQYDIPCLVHKCTIPKDIEVIDLGAWNNHPLAIKAFKERIDQYIKLNHQS